MAIYRRRCPTLRASSMLGFTLLLAGCAGQGAATLHTQQQRPLPRHSQHGRPSCRAGSAQGQGLANCYESIRDANEGLDKVTKLAR